MSDTKAPDPFPGQLPVSFTKAPGYRVVHVDGAWFGGNATGSIYLSLYSEHTTLPTKMVVNVNERGFVTGMDESKTVHEPGLERQVEVDIVLSASSALQLLETLKLNMSVMTGALEAAKKQGGQPYVVTHST